MGNLIQETNEIVKTIIEASSDKAKRDQIRNMRDSARNQYQDLSKEAKKASDNGEVDRAAMLTKKAKEFAKTVQQHNRTLRATAPTLKQAQQAKATAQSDYEVQMAKANRFFKQGKPDLARKILDKAKKTSDAGQAQSAIIKKKQARKPTVKQVQALRDDALNKQKRLSDKADSLSKRGDTKRADELRAKASKFGSVAMAHNKKLKAHAQKKAKAVAKKDAPVSAKPSASPTAKPASKTGQSWWDNMNPEDKKAYLQAHPKSRMAKKQN